MKLLKLLSILFFFVAEVHAQEGDNFWLLGIGFNVVDDMGIKSRQYADVDDNWHMVPFPSRASVGYFLNNGLGFQLIGTYNHYKSGRMVDGTELLGDRDYVGIDTQISYSLNRVFGHMGWFDPYLAAGGGYTWVGDIGRPTLNAGGGSNIWLSDRVGINLNAVGKFSVKDREVATNHAQYSIGVVFKLTNSKGEELLTNENIVEVESVPEPVADTTSVVEIEKEKIIDAGPTEAELLRQKILNEFEAVKQVYFAFDSSHLTSESKERLDVLVAFMDMYPDVVVSFGAHADSRGPATYNIGLTERRAAAVADYLNLKGLSSERFYAKGYGESNLVNHCSDGVKCTEEEHRLNRRASFELLED
ncbi:OmpA family protein [Galbibacter sp. EGI 63066]|uniref:OmpA family protein n=1 Tax=Galbibacter sp. EGI 63066 TaxID=2993559 RepID=UPI002249798B|nr:OmpA family protein [Galbibacter sp. EGI 63066]MCX2679662.1 OmpA family protein [Galbibacter sp. EGI 63066]